jgi:hypothetical protein
VCDNLLANNIAYHRIASHRIVYEVKFDGGLRPWFKNAPRRLRELEFCRSSDGCESERVGERASPTAIGADATVLADATRTSAAPGREGDAVGDAVGELEPDIDADTEGEAVVNVEVLGGEPTDAESACALPPSPASGRRRGEPRAPAPIGTPGRRIPGRPRATAPRPAPAPAPVVAAPAPAPVVAAATATAVVVDGADDESAIDGFASCVVTAVLAAEFVAPAVAMDILALGAADGNIVRRLAAYADTPDAVPIVA